MARKQPNTAKAIVWTERARQEMEGPTNSIVYYMFMSVPECERQKLIDDMIDWHEKTKT